jgi:ribonuclease E
MDDEMSELDHPVASSGDATPETPTSDATASDSPGEDANDSDIDAPTVRTGPKKRRRGSRGGKGRKRPAGAAGSVDDDDDDEFDDDVDDSDDADEIGTTAGTDTTSPAIEALVVDADASDDVVAAPKPQRAAPARKKAPAKKVAEPVAQVGDADVEFESDAAEANAETELPERTSEGRVMDPEVAERALVPSKPKIGDTRPAPPGTTPVPAAAAATVPAEARPKSNNNRNSKRTKQGGGGNSGNQQQLVVPAEMSMRAMEDSDRDDDRPESAASKKRRRNSRGKKSGAGGGSGSSVADLDADAMERRRGRERNGRPVGRYLMCVQVREGLTQVAVLEGRSLVEHYVSRPADDVNQIHGNIYLGRVQNVLPGMEAAFVDISTPKNAVLYRGDVQYDSEDIVERNSDKLRIEQMLKARQLIVCQITKNPIGAKGARLTQEVSLPGRFVVLIPNSKTYGISKRLPDDERKRLRNILDRVKPAEHGMIVRTAAENATEQELRADVLRLAATWQEIERKAETARKSNKPQLLYREPELAVRVIREEFNADYRGVIIDDQRLHDDVKGYITVMNPELGDRVEAYDDKAEGLSIFEKYHVHEQLHKALDRKVWLPSGGSLIIEHTEALTVIDVNTGKNVGTSNLEQTVFHNNLEAADEIARQLRLRDVGGIIVIDFIDMEIRENRKKVVDAFRQALSRDKTRSQVFDISDLGLVEMTRKRIGEGLLTSFAQHCPNCDGRGVVVDLALLD